MFPFTIWLWLSLVALQGSLLLSVASDFAGWQAGRPWEGMLNTVTMASLAVRALAAMLVALWADLLARRSAS